MARRAKAAENCKISYWLTAKTGKEKDGRFIQVGNSLFFSKEVQGLTAGARWLYLCMAEEAGGKREYNFTHTTAKKYGISSSSFDRQKKELIEKGFIEDISGVAQYAPGKYRFCFDWKA